MKRRRSRSFTRRCQLPAAILHLFLLCGAAALGCVASEGAPGACPPIPLGRFAQPTLTGTGSLCNLNHNIIVERGFKLLYLAPQRKGERWGAPTFAGFFTLALNGTPAYTLIEADKPGDGTRTLLAAPTMGRYAKDYRGDFGRATVGCEDAIGNPVVRFSAEVRAARRPVTAEWLVTGWEWDRQPAPTHWEWFGANGRQALRLSRQGVAAAPTLSAAEGSRRDSYVLRLPPGEGFLLAWNEGQPYTLALLPSVRPQAVRIGRNGVALRFAKSTIAAGRRSALPDLCAAVVEPHAPDALLRILPALARSHGELHAQVGSRGGGAVVRYVLGADDKAFVPVPPPFSTLVKGAASQNTPLGAVTFVPGRQVELKLPSPPNLDLLVNEFPPLPPEEKALVAADVKAILDHQNADGTFTFSLGRPFYDGQTAGVLVQLAPLLDEPLRGQVNAAVRKTLDYWWGRLMTDARTGVVVFPEPVMPSAVVDYPEISATILYPTAAYAQLESFGYYGETRNSSGMGFVSTISSSGRCCGNTRTPLVDRDYARQIWPKAAALAATLPRAYDITGSAWAHAGPEYVHILTESTIGGYLAYASLYHLARLAGQEPAANEFRARACWAFAAMDLYRWREEYGRGGILSQIFGDGLFVEPALAWDYTMFTWFSWCPLWRLPRDDRYHVWEVLRQQRWWLYFRDSRQLAYDFSHFMALVRFGDPAEGLAHWDEILKHEPTFDNFDTVALYRPLARAWRAAYLVRTKGTL